MSSAKAVLLFMLLFTLILTGCSQKTSTGQSPAPIPTPVPQQTAPSAVSDSAAVPDSASVPAVMQSAVRAFLANDFAGAQKTMLFQPVELKDPKTQRLFADFSAHLNKRLALEAKDAGLKTPAPSITVSEVRADQAAGILTAEVSIQAASGTEPFKLTLKAKQGSGAWLVDYSSFMLALIDALDE